MVGGEKHTRHEGHVEEQKKKNKKTAYEEAGIKRREKKRGKRPYERIPTLENWLSAGMHKVTEGKKKLTKSGLNQMLLRAQCNPVNGR